MSYRGVCRRSLACPLKLSQSPIGWPGKFRVGLWETARHREKRLNPMWVCERIWVRSDNPIPRLDNVGGSTRGFGWFSNIPYHIRTK